MHYLATQKLQLKIFAGLAPAFDARICNNLHDFGGAVHVSFYHRCNLFVNPGFIPYTQDPFYQLFYLSQS